jgi:hypothetical protein
MNLPVPLPRPGAIEAAPNEVVRDMATFALLLTKYPAFAGAVKADPRETHTVATVVEAYLKDTSLVMGNYSAQTWR